FINIFINRSADDKHIKIKIQDTGIGMTAETAAHAFDLFYEGHEFSHNSSGLGLALCKELVELHHGMISVNSEKWRGTCFEIALPAGRDHLLPEEIETEGSHFRMSPDVGIYTADVEPV